MKKIILRNPTAAIKFTKPNSATFAVLICYDQWFPEAARRVRLEGAEIIFYPTALGNIIGYKAEGDWHDAWETSMRGHAIANSVYVAALTAPAVKAKCNFLGNLLFAILLAKS